MIWLFVWSTAFLGLAIFFFTPSLEGVKIGLIVMVGGLIVAFFVDPLLDDLENPESVDYGVPLCPEDGLKHYEMSLAWKDDDVVWRQFQEKGWTNLTVFSKADGGIFGGYTDYISGDCEAP